MRHIAGYQVSPAPTLMPLLEAFASGELVKVMDQQTGETIAWVVGKDNSKKICAAFRDGDS